jgi:hypothetical protein
LTSPTYRTVWNIQVKGSVDGVAWN